MDRRVTGDFWIVSWLVVAHPTARSKFGGSFSPRRGNKWGKVGGAKGGGARREAESIAHRLAVTSATLTQETFSSICGQRTGKGDDATMTKGVAFVEKGKVPLKRKADITK